MKLLLISFAFILSTGCTTVPRQSFNKEAGASIKSLLIAEREDKETYEVDMQARPGPRGLISDIINAGIVSSRSDTLTEALNPEKTLLRKQFLEALSAKLKAAGYEPRMVAIPKGLDEKSTLSALNAAGQTDALLYADLNGAYIAATVHNPYLPHLSVKVKVVAARSNVVLYEDTITWGYRLGKQENPHINGGYAYPFDDFDALLAKPDLTRRGLIEGIAPLAEHIANALTKK
jgi:hypothetical protein